MPSSPVYVGDPPATGFRYETDLAQPVRSWLSSWTDMFVEEFRVQTIADLVGVHERTPGYADRRAREIEPIVLPIQLGVLEYCSVDRSERELREWAPHGWRSLRERALLPLVAKGYMEFEGGVARRLVEPVDPFISLVAVELKLRDWRSALCQVVGYGAFAEYAFMALPADVISDETVKQACKNGVGLLSVGSFVETVVEAERRQVLQPKRRRLASELFMAQYRDCSLHRRAGAPIVATGHSASSE